MNSLDKQRYGDYSRELEAFRAERKGQTCLKQTQYLHEVTTRYRPDVAFMIGATSGAAVGMTIGGICGGVCGTTGGPVGTFGGIVIGGMGGAAIGGAVGFTAAYIHYRQWLKTDEAKEFCHIIKEMLLDDERFRDYYCVIDGGLPEDPVINSKRGDHYQVYEREAIEGWIKHHLATDPVTGNPLKAKYLVDSPHNEMLMWRSMYQSITEDIPRIEKINPGVARGMKEAQNEIKQVSRKLYRQALDKLEYKLDEGMINQKKFDLQLDFMRQVYYFK